MLPGGESSEDELVSVCVTALTIIQNGSKGVRNCSELPKPVCAPHLTCTYTLVVYALLE